MRVRNVKNKKDILNSSNLFIDNPHEYKRKWYQLFQNNNPLYIEIGSGKMSIFS
jgi:tRNA (guanine-N7-)-methyltransferase